MVVSKVVSVYDGDTFTVNIDGWPSFVGSEVSVQIYGIDTPEMTANGKVLLLAQEAKRITVQLLTAAQRVELRDMRRDKYFRINAEVFVDGQNLGSMLITRGLAKPYFGGEKPRWSASDYHSYKGGAK